MKFLDQHLAQQCGFKNPLRPGFKALLKDLADLQLANPGTNKAYVPSIFIKTTYFLVKADINRYFLTLLPIS